MSLLLFITLKLIEQLAGGYWSLTQGNEFCLLPAMLEATEDI